MAERTVASQLSRSVIGLLTKRGMTLTEIADGLGVTKSFLSRVKSGTRGLTIDHLVALERQLGEPLPLLIVQATPIESVPKDLRPLYRSTVRVLSAGAGKTKRPSRRRAKAA